MSPERVSASGAVCVPEALLLQQRRAKSKKRTPNTLTIMKTCIDFHTKPLIRKSDIEIAPEPLITGCGTLQVHLQIPAATHTKGHLSGQCGERCREMPHRGSCMVHVNYCEDSERMATDTDYYKGTQQGTTNNKKPLNPYTSLIQPHLYTHTKCMCCS